MSVFPGGAADLIAVAVHGFRLAWMAVFRVGADVVDGRGGGFALLGHAGDRALRVRGAIAKIHVCADRQGLGGFGGHDVSREKERPRDGGLGIARFRAEETSTSIGRQPPAVGVAQEGLEGNRASGGCLWVGAEGNGCGGRTESAHEKARTTCVGGLWAH